MSGKIRVLSDQTINEIAAGEVIENPSSVIKELVENAIDADSTEITIEIRGGGRQLIRITDNGCGMIPDDALLCLERHATSKIRSSNDIFSVGTLGFRGEAVPSIAAISKFTLLTSPRGHENPQGTLVLVDGGKIISSGPAAREPGTTFEIKQLFFNVPVRKKFQRSPVYDAQEIEKLCIAFALAHPQIQFTLISNEERVLKTGVGQGEDILGQRIEALLGSDLRAQMKPINASLDGFSLQGYIGLPSLHRPNRTGQYLFINGRSVVSPWIGHLIKESFGTMLPSGRHPLFILNLLVPNGCVDVNVHPQKREVRFSYDLNIKELVRTAINPVLHPAFELHQEERETPFSPTPLPPPAWKNNVWAVDSLEIEEDVEINTSKKAPPPHRNIEQFTKPLPWENETPISLSSPPQSLQTALNIPSSPIPSLLCTMNGYLLLDGNSLKGSSLYPEKSDDCAFALIDQRRAHHRIIYESCLDQNKGVLALQSLLVPHPLQLSTIESQLLARNNDTLRKIGISLLQIGPQTWVVESIPQLLGSVNIQALIEEILEALQHEKADLLSAALADKLATHASHNAVARSSKLSFEEGRSLLAQLCSCKQPLFCPKGKPIIIALSNNELQKRFG
ncbi:MAG: DNA mismatch repair endonuclease MutL [Parachlamydiales bacterium]|jgi:DNA mismatch repair protein MutL